MDRGAFEGLVSDALDALPDEVLDLLDNVAVIVEDDPPADDPQLLGLYEGVPLTDRTGEWDAMSLPDRIIVFRHSTLAICETAADVAREVHTTIVHEIAHFHGINEERIEELGWG